MRYTIVFLFALNVCFAQFPVLNEKFDGGCSDEFVKSVKIDPKRTTEENVDTGNGESGALVFDYPNEKNPWASMLLIPGVSVGRDVYKISFDYKILSLLGNPNPADACIARIEERWENRVFIHDEVCFGVRAGEKGRVELFSGPANNGLLSFFLSGRDRVAKIAIDNFKVEKLKPFPDWMYDKNLFFGLAIPPSHPNFYYQNPNLSTMTKEQFFPFMDKFGQYKHKEWPNKIHSMDDFKERIVQEDDYNAKTPDIGNRDKYFGWIDPNRKYKFKATGRFRTQKVDGKWFLVTPEGNLFWAMGVNAVGLYQPTVISKREYFFEDVPDEKDTVLSRGTRFIKEPHRIFCFERRNLAWKYGKKWTDDYGKIADVRARKWGINAFAWATDYVIRNSSIPFIATLDSIIKYPIKTKAEVGEFRFWHSVPDYFDPKFRRDTMEMVARNADAIKDPRCVGVTIGNELSWHSKSLTLARAIIQSVRQQPAKLKFVEFLKDKYHAIDALNSAWRASYSDWDDFLKTDTFLPSTKEAQADMLAIEDLYYRAYFSACRDAVKSVSPDAMYMGCRFAWGTDAVKKVAAEYMDVVTINSYTNFAWEKLPDGAVDKPIIISEYSFGNQDRGVFGGGLRIRKTMKERIAANNAFIGSALKNPHVVGAIWFRWADQITSGRLDGENYAFGMVDVCDTPFYDFANSVRKLSKNMYNIRINSDAR